MVEKVLKRLKGKVLIVDDSAAERELISTYLLRALPEIEILTAPNGPTALQTLGATPVDLILLDYRLPVVDGLQVLAHLQQVYSIPVIMVTGMGSQRVGREAMALGAADYVVKSIGYHKELPKLVAKFMGSKAIDSKAVEPSTFEFQASASVETGIDDPGLEEDIAELGLVPSDLGVTAQTQPLESIQQETPPVKEQYDLADKEKMQVDEATRALVMELDSKVKTFSVQLSHLIGQTATELQPFDDSLDASKRLVDGVRDLESTAHTEVCQNCVNRLSPIREQTESMIENSRSGLNGARQGLQNILDILDSLQEGALNPEVPQNPLRAPAPASHISRPQAPLNLQALL